MSYLSWFNAHANKHKKIVEKLLTLGNTKEQIIEYFDFENMVQNESDFCLLYAQNKKCHDMKKLNCYLCACPNFRFQDNGIKNIQDKVQYSFCAIDSKEGKAGIYANAIHQDCSQCTVPHAKSYVMKHFDVDWKTIMKACNKAP